MRGMSRSDKGCAGSGEDGKTTSEQEGIYAVAPVGLARTDSACFALQNTIPALRFPGPLVTFGTKVTLFTILQTPCL